jgi:hypothetical protein
MLITEEEKNDILSKYSENTSDELLNHLKRTFPVYEETLDWLEKPIKFMSVDLKSTPIIGNKKYLTNKIYNLISDDWGRIGEPMIRRTIKKYIDGFSQF